MEPNQKIESIGNQLKPYFVRLHKAMILFNADFRDFSLEEPTTLFTQYQVLQTLKVNSPATCQPDSLLGRLHSRMTSVIQEYKITERVEAANVSEPVFKHQIRLFNKECKLLRIEMLELTKSENRKIVSVKETGKQIEQNA